MEWLDTLLGGGAGLAAGGPLGLIAGLFGGWLQQRQKRKMAELEAADRQAARAHEIALLDAQTSNMIKEAEIGLKVTQTEADIAADLARYDVDKEVLKLAQGDIAKPEEILFSDTELEKSRVARFFSCLMRVLFGLVEMLRRLYRPAASYYSMAGLTYLVLWLTSELAKRNIELTDEQVVTMWFSIVDTCLFLAVTCVTWWFISREKQHAFGGLSNVNKRGD